jgi:hypothetical protein
LAPSEYLGKSNKIQALFIIHKELLLFVRFKQDHFIRHEKITKLFEKLKIFLGKCENFYG